MGPFSFSFLFSFFPLHFFLLFFFFLEFADVYTFTKLAVHTLKLN